MSYSRRSRYSPSPSPYRGYERSRSVLRSISRRRSRSRSVSVDNPGNNLYVTGLSSRVTRRDLQKHFSSEGKVEDVHLVVDPRTKESRGFGFVSMSSLDEARRCLKYLNGSVLEGRVITVEKSRRCRGRTPTPGRYPGSKADRVRHRSPSYSSSYKRDRSRSYSPYYTRRRSRSYSPYHSRYSKERHYAQSRSPSWSPRRRDRSYSPYYTRRRSRSYSPYHSRYSKERHYARSRSPSWSPRRRDRSYSPYNYLRYQSPGHRGYRRSHYRSVSRSVSPRRYYSPDHHHYRSRRSYSRSVSPWSRRPSPRTRRDYSVSRSCSASPASKSVGRSITPSSASPSSS